jgi:hypothetical protein
MGTVLTPKSSDNVLHSGYVPHVAFSVSKMTQVSNKDFPVISNDVTPFVYYTAFSNDEALL